MLASCHDNAGKLIIVDGIFSMAGDIAPLPEIIKLCEKYNARLMVDDAHSIGVLGDHGRGTANYFGVEDKVDIIMGTFSKIFCQSWRFIAGDEDTIFYVQHTARSFIFSASMSPANTAAALAALEVMQEEPERIEHLWKISNRMREGLKSLGFDIGNSCTLLYPYI